MSAVSRVAQPRAVRPIPPLARDRAFLALAALLVLLDLPGDLLTTAVGLRSGSVEQNPFAALVLARWSWPGLVAWKLTLLMAWLAWAIFARSRGPFGRRVALAATLVFCALAALICLGNLGLLPQFLYGMPA